MWNEGDEKGLKSKSPAAVAACARENTHRISKSQAK